MKSKYTAYEITILHHRRRKQGEHAFLIIPVFLDPIGQAELDNSLLEAIPLLEIQSSLKEGSPQKIVEAVVKKIKQASNLIILDNFNARYLVEDVLKEVPPIVLEGVACKLEIPIDEWIPDDNDNLKKKVALKLLGKGIEGGRTSIRKLEPHLSDVLSAKKNKMIDLIGYVASSWVGFDCVQKIKESWQEQIFFVLNNKDPDLPKFYLYNIEAPKASWRIYPIADIPRENFLQSLIERIWENLKKRLRQADEKELKKRLERDYDNENPICINIVSKLKLLDKDIVEKLRTEFPHIVFFLMVEGNIPEHEESEQMGLQLLEPYLEESDEEKLCQTYRYYLEDFQERIKNETG